VDVLWSQLYRTERAIVTLLENQEFSVVKSASWSDEKSLNVVLLELEEGTLPSSRRHLGPPVSRAEESASFVAKHLGAKDTISGPWIDSNRWVIEKKRERTSAEQLLKDELRSGGRSLGVASEPARAMRRRVEVRSGASIAPLIARSTDFAKAMNAFLSRRPPGLG